MPRLSLRKTEVPEGIAEHSRELIGSISSLDDEMLDVATRLVGVSEPFRKFIEYIHEFGTPGMTRLIDVSEEFRRAFAAKIGPFNRGETSPDEEPPNWMSFLLKLYPHILRGNLSHHYTELSEGWHSIHSPDTERYEDAKGKGLLMYCARRPLVSGMPAEGQRNVLSEFFPDIADMYGNPRLPSNKLESKTNLRHGRINIFLSDDALANFEGLAMHKSMAFGAKGNEVIVFPIHTRLLFACKAEELASWLMTNEARFAYGDKLRIQGHKFDATVDDLAKVDTKALPSLKGFWSWKERAVLEGKIPLDVLPKAYIGQVDKVLKLQTPHLSWRNETIMEALQVRQNLERFLRELDV